MSTTDNTVPILLLSIVKKGENTVCVQTIQMCIQSIIELMS